MRIRATFTGTDGSLGYRQGQTYDLNLEHTGRHPAVVTRLDGTGYSPYDSIEAFFQSWTAAGPPYAHETRAPDA